MTACQAKVVWEEEIPLIATTDEGDSLADKKTE